MKNKRKKALVFVLIITLIMALAMSTMHYIFGYNYENSEMVK
ncbi:CPBP family intramembrane metalloprotease, partial [Staphylococcus equorum]